MSTSSSQTPLTGDGSLIGLGVCVLLALVAIWLPALPTGMDLPTHAAMGAMLADPDAFAPWVEVGWARTSQGFVLLVAALAAWLPVQTALCAALSILVLVQAGGAWLWAGALGVRAHGTWPLAVAIVHGFALAMGFANFQWGVALGLWASWASMVALQRRSGALVLLAVVLWLVTAHAHAVAAALVGLAAGPLLVMMRSPGGAPLPRRAQLHRAAWVAAMAAPGAIYAAVVLFGVRVVEDATRAQAGVGARPVPWQDVVRNLGRTGFGGPLPSGGEVLAWLAVVVVIGGVVGLARSRGAAAVAGLAVLGLLYVALPFHLQGWEYAQPRPWIVALTVAAVVGVLPARFPRLATWTPTVLAAAWLGASAWGQVVLANQTLPVLAALGDGPTGRTMTVRMQLGDAVGSVYTLPWLHLDGWVVAAGGAPAGWAQFHHGMHSVVLRDGIAPWTEVPPAFIARGLDCETQTDCLQNRATLLDRSAVQGLGFDTVLLVGCTPADARAMVDRGYAAPAPCRFHPRPTQVEVAGQLPAWTTNVPVQITLDYAETIGSFAGGVLAPADRGAALSLPLGAVPQGAALLVVRDARNRAVLGSHPVVVGGGARQTLSLPSLQLPGRAAPPPSALPLPQ